MKQQLKKRPRLHELGIHKSQVARENPVLSQSEVGVDSADKPEDSQFLKDIIEFDRQVEDYHRASRQASQQ